MSDFSEVPMLVAFTSFNGYTGQTDRLEDAHVARVMNAFYEFAGSAIRSAGGQIVKFIGDAALAVFPSEAADRGTLPGPTDVTTCSGRRSRWLRAWRPVAGSHCQPRRLEASGRKLANASRSIRRQSRTFGKRTPIVHGGPSARERTGVI